MQPDENSLNRNRMFLEFLQQNKPFENLAETIRGGPIYGQQANNIYASNGNYRDDEETRSIEFMDDEESFYIIGRRSPEHNLPNTSNSLKLTFLNVIWISLFAIPYGQNRFLWTS